MIATINSTPDLATELFSGFEKGRQLVAGLDEINERRVASWAGVYSELTALESLSPESMPDELREDLANQSLTFSLEEIAVERAKAGIKSAESLVLTKFAGKLVTVRALKGIEVNPITEFSYQGGVYGSRDWEPKTFQRRKATGRIESLFYIDGKLRITPRKLSYRRMDQGYWDVKVLDEDGEPLVEVDFLDAS